MLDFVNLVGAGSAWFWPPGRTHWARDYVELDHDLTPDEWIRLLRDLLDRVFDL